MLRSRIIVGTLLSAGMLALFLLDGYLARTSAIAWAPVFFVVVGLVAVACVYELASLLRRRGWRIYEMPALAAILAILSLAAITHATGNRLLFQLGPVIVGPTSIVLTLLVMAILVAETVRAWGHDSIDMAIQSIGGTLLATLYVGLLLQFIVAIRFLHEPNGLHCLLTFVGVTKSCDIGAYCAGRLVGRHKLIPRLSPGKTVEGCAGGMVLSIASALVMGQVLLGYMWQQCVLFGGVVSVFAIVGDLVESLIKRASEAKDSGEMVPGFGGVLDIMDSLLLAAPAAYVLLVLFGAT